MKHMKLPQLALLIFLGMAFTDCSTQEELPNIVIILVDDMGYGDPGCYNPESKISTPNIDGLASSGMRFTDAHAAGALCHPSRYGLMTGQYPFRTDVSVWRKEPVIKEDQHTIASLLNSRGYHTAMVGKWHLGFKENGYENPLPGGPVDRGFDSFFGIRASTDIPPYFYIRDNQALAPPTDHIDAESSEGWSPIQGSFWREGGIAPDLELKDVLPRFTNEAIEVIKDHSRNEVHLAKPLMLYLAYPAPHTPWLPSPEFEGKSGAGMYGDFLMMVDAQIGMVLSALDAAGMSENTLVVFTSDNGPVWYDEDVNRLGHDSSGGLRGMKADTWEAGHRMPFIVRWPGQVSKGSISNQTICFTDILATCGAVTNTDLPEGAGPDSYSFLPVLMGDQPEDQPIRPSIVMQSANGSMLIRSGEWKLINQLGSGGFSAPQYIEPGPGDPMGQLYNMANDPGEENNLYLEHPEIVDRLSSEMTHLILGSVISTNGQIDYMKQWPQFRGPFASGIVEDASLPVSWNIHTGENIKWKIEIPGLGHSCPVVWGDKLFVTTAISGSGKDSLKVGLYGDIDEVNDRSVHEFRVYCIDKFSGEIIWEKLAHKGVPGTERHTKSSHANPTPATDGKHLVAFFGSEGMYCYDMDGNLLWKKDFGTMNAGPYTDPEVEWGFASSPILHEGRIVVQCDFLGDGFIASLEVETGKEIWRTPREEISTWSTPNFYSKGSNRQVVVNGWNHMGGFNFDTGEQIWELSGGGDAPTPTPIFGHDLIYLHGSHGRYSPIFAIRPNAKGDITLHKDSTSSKFIPWSIKRGASYMPTNLIYGEYLYNLRMNGNLTCYKATTGEVIYKERIEDAMGITASGVASDGKLFYSLEQGDVVVVKPGPGFEILSRNPLDDLIMATPAISEGMLYFRTQKFLIAVN